MTRNTQPIAQYMSGAPVCIQLDAELDAAVELMERHGIRHLPVLDGTKLTGIVSDRDLGIIASILPGEKHRIRVAESMTPNPYTVTPDTPLRDVARGMADRKYGCALVVDDNGTLLGVFSTHDALRILAGSD